MSAVYRVIRKYRETGSISRRPGLFAMIILVKQLYILLVLSILACNEFKPACELEMTLL